MKTAVTQNGIVTLKDINLSWDSINNINSKMLKKQYFPTQHSEVFLF